MKKHSASFFFVAATVQLSLFATPTLASPKSLITVKKALVVGLFCSSAQSLPIASPQSTPSVGEYTPAGTNSSVCGTEGNFYPVIRTPVGELPSSNSIGVQNTIFMLVNFADKPNEKPWSVQEIQDTTIPQLNKFLQETSYGQASLNGQAVGWYTLSISSTSPCNPETIAQEADDAANLDGKNVSNFPRRVYIFPSFSQCAWAGLGTIGGNPSYTWVNGGNVYQTTAHELGHNFGLYHANALNCGGETLRASCSRVEYADPSDAMGNIYPGHYNAYHKEQLNWLNTAATPKMTLVRADGNFILEPLESATSNVKALKVLKEKFWDGSSDYYYIEFRQPIGVDDGLKNVGSSSGGNLVHGVQIRIGNDENPDSSVVLDMNARTSSFRDSALAPARAFNDPNAPQGGVSICVNSIGPEGANVTVAFGTTLSSSAQRISVNHQMLPHIAAIVLFSAWMMQ